MSSTSNSIRYNIVVGEYSGGTLLLYGSDGFTDAMALGLASTLKNFTWPAGFAANVTVTKVDVTETDSSGDLSTNPGTFV